MAESVLMGAALGGGSAMLTGQDPLKGAALGGAMGGVGGAMSSAPATAGGVSGATTAAANGSMTPLVSQQVAGNAALSGVNGAATAAANGSMTPVGSGFSNIASSAMDGFTDLTGMTGQDLGGMAFNKGINALAQPEQQQQIQAAPMGQGISRPQVDLSQSRGSLLSSNPMTSGAGGQQLTPEQMQKLKQQGLL